MSIPAPVRLAEIILSRFRFPVVTVGVSVCLPLLALYISAGALSPLPDFAIWENPMEIIGLFLMLAILPACLLMWFTAWVRRSATLIPNLQAQAHTSATTENLRYRYAAYWPLALILGILFAIFGNISTSSISLDPESEIFAMSVAMVFGQILMWSIIFVILFLTLIDDIEISRCGREVQVNIYNLDHLNDFGRAALSQFLMVIGALALTILQSLDREFRWVNYATGLYVGVPAAIVFILLPTWTVRKNIRLVKQKTLALINAELQQASTALDNESLVRMNGLIERRERVQQTRTWPMDVSIFSRFLFYIFIPPLAWLGAALMEVMLDSYIAG